MQKQLRNLTLKNEFGSARKPENRKQKAMIPHFTTEPVSAVVSQNSNITLSCAVFPASAEIRWMVDNRLLQESNPYGFRPVEGQLWIPSIPDEYRELMFQCVADTPWGTILSRRANISLAVLHKFEERKDLHLNVSVGSNVMLPCQPPGSRPPATIMFRYNQSKIINSDTDRFKILPSGNLQILRVTTSDQGQYQCMAENKMRGRADSNCLGLNSGASLFKRVPNQEPAVIMPRTEFQATVRDNVILECSAIGNPQPVITWEKYGGILLPGRYRQIYDIQ
ncbi:CDON-like protein [Mya arenaria]|uniref:CDON-like protein n=1 Tax=Mya arenaria TaxID=6604 RepID=A0ABY7E368_MYAAR|nr:CDON-like protein [Mya arenaria]